MSRNILVLDDNSSDNNLKTTRAIYKCTTFEMLKNYIYNNLTHIDDFHLHISIQYLEELLTDGLEKHEQIRCINIYNYAIQSGDNRALKNSEHFAKFKFFSGRIMESSLENAEINAVIHSTQEIDRPAIDTIATARIERLTEKRRNSADHYSPEAKRSSSNVQIVRNNCFICPACVMFFQETYKLTCGHQICKLCLDSKDKCAVCLGDITKNEAQFDRENENKKQQLLTTCLQCTWEGSYENYLQHADQNHRNTSNNDCNLNSI